MPTFLLASHDTISHALTWTWLLLAAYPDVEEQLGAEVANILGTRLPEAHDVPRLVCTRRFQRCAGKLLDYVPQQASLSLISCGAKYAIASRGNWSAEGRWAWWWKD
jgi:hypothetical protein